MEKWVEELKVGDKIYTPPAGMTGGTIHTITKITKTEIVTKTNRFNKETKKATTSNSSWYAIYFEQFTPELQAAYNHSKLVKEVNKINFRSLSTENLEKILEIALSEEKIVKIGD
jgi:tartrate dehydratase beta subunit/fumarate hydratase class I family protein